MRAHRALGPGLRERDYRDCFLIELEEAGAAAEREVHCDLVYKGTRLERAVRFDVIVDGHLLLELKAVDVLHPQHFLQARSYVRSGGFSLGVLVNFHAPRLVDGWHRILPGRHFPGVAPVAAVASSHAEQKTPPSPGGSI